MSSPFKPSTDMDWLESIRCYVLSKGAKILDLRSLDLTKDNIRSILEFLVDSEICELDLSRNNLENQMTSLSELLIRTNIKALNVSSCKLTKQDVISLMRILKDSQITSLNFSSSYFSFHPDESDWFISYFTQCHLTELNLSGSRFLYNKNLCQFINAVCRKSSITHLNVDGLLCYDVDLLLRLKETSITHLSAASNYFNRSGLSKLGDSLRESKLVELDLSNNGLNDTHIDELCKALVGTQVTTLSLRDSCYDGSNRLFHYLKDTKIEKLDLSNNDVYKDTVFDLQDVYNENMFNFPHFLSGTSVVSLNLQRMGLSNNLGEKIIESLKFSKLEELYMGGNRFELATLSKFACIVTQTSIIKVDFPDTLVSTSPQRKKPLVATLLEKVRNSNITSLKVGTFHLDETIAQVAFSNLIDSKLTHLDLRSCQLGTGFSSLVSNLKFTVITDLNLRENDLSDEDVEILAESLKETHITTLNLSYNSITDRGANFLAFSLEGTKIFSLKLNKNKINDEGMQLLAENAQKTLMTTLKVSNNPGNRRIVETVIWNNRRVVSQLVNFFKRMAPESGNSFRFKDNPIVSDVETFLEECLDFYVIVTKYSSVPRILLREASFGLLGRDKITELLVDEFPRQFVEFIVTKIEVDVSEHVNILKKVEENGFSRIVELLLLHRPMYTIDISLSILHPYVYCLLNKYKHPICPQGFNPNGIKTIIKYFDENQNIDHADEAIIILKHIESSL